MKKTISVLLMFALCLTFLPLFASANESDDQTLISEKSIVDYGSIMAMGYCGDNVTWTLYNSGYILIEGEGAMCDYPSYTNSNNYYRKYIKHVIIGDGVTRIGAGAFKYCYSLETVEMADSVLTIGGEAFHACSSLKSISLSQKLIGIDNDFTFWKCTSLASIRIPASVSYIGNYAFINCTNLREVYFEGGAVSFGFYTFKDEVLTAYYPAENPTWTVDAMNRSGGYNITWVPYYPEEDQKDEITKPVLSPDSAAAFIGFLTNGVNPKTKKNWTQDEIESSVWYQIMTDTYTGDNYAADAEGLVVYATVATSAMASKAANNYAYLNNEIVRYLEKEAGMHDNLDAEIINELQNEAGKKLTEAIYGLIDYLLPVSADSVFSVTDVYKEYCSVVGTAKKGEVIAKRVAAAIEAGIMVMEAEKVGRYTYFSTYLFHRGGYISQNDSIFRAIMDSNRTIISDANWIANIINLFTWLTNKESFNKHYDTIEEWAEYIYQLSCYQSGYCVETSATMISEEKLSYSINGTSVSITASNAELSGHILLPSDIENNTVLKIDIGAFQGQTKIESVKIGDKIEEIGGNAFQGCTALQSVAITSNVKIIGETSFENCTALETVVIPDSVTYIADNAFWGCTDVLTVICDCDNDYIINYCSTNGINYTPVHGFGEYISDENGNCDFFGSMTAQCEACSAIDTIMDWSSKDTHEWEGKIIKEPTESQDGEYAITCVKCGEYQTKAVPVLKFTGASLYLQNNLTVNYKVNEALFTESGYENPYVIFERNGEKTAVTAYLDDGDRYVFSYRNIAPDQMNDTISATLYATYNGVQYASQTRKYSVAEYCYSMLELYSDDQHAELRTLLVDLLHYGGASQAYTGYNAERPVDQSLTETQLAWGTNKAPTLTTVLDTAYQTVENPKAIWKGASLNLKDSVSMRFKLTTESIEGLKVKITSGENTWVVSSFVEEDGVYYVHFGGLNAAQMRQEVYLTVYEGDIPVSNTVCYSIESYAYEKHSSTVDGLAELIKAMMCYGDSAHAYIN